MIFRTQQGRVAALNRWGGKLKYLLMAYTLSNTCAKNLCKWTLLVQMIIKNVVTFFLEHSVYGHTLKSPLSLWDTGLTSTCWRLRAEAMGCEVVNNLPKFATQQRRYGDSNQIRRPATTPPVTATSVSCLLVIGKSCVSAHSAAVCPYAKLADNK